MDNDNPKRKRNKPWVASPRRVGVVLATDGGVATAPEKSNITRQI